jgi:hypothetical protein
LDVCVPEWNLHLFLNAVVDLNMGAETAVSDCRLKRARKRD